MKITITVNNKFDYKDELVLFGARYNYMTANFGNKTSIELKSLEFDKDYKKEIGIDDAIEGYESVYGDGWWRFHAFIMDCVKYDFEILSINGNIPEVKFNGVDKKTTRYLDPYLQTYKMEITSGISKIEIELRKKEIVYW